MLTYFQNGGFSMWIILLAAVAAIVGAVASAGEVRVRALLAGSHACLIGGVFGMATGMVAVSQNIGRYADKGAAVAEGLGELSSNGTFAAVLSTALVVAAAVVRKVRGASS